jgi:hypothetical protein
MANSRLLEVFFDALGFTEQVGNVLVGDFQEVPQDVQGLVKLCGEFDVLLVAPGVRQGGVLAMQPRQPITQITVKLLQQVSKPP